MNYYNYGPYTSGPWQASALGIYFDNEYTIIGTNGATLVANVLHSPEATEECRANANLVAAAPKLLAACLMAQTLGSCDVCVEDGCDADCDCWCHEQDVRTRKQIAAAIAAAEGQPLELREGGRRDATDN